VGERLGQPGPHLLGVVHHLLGHEHAVAHHPAVPHGIEALGALQRERGLQISRPELDHERTGEQPAEEVPVHLGRRRAEHLQRLDAAIARQPVIEEGMVLLGDLDPGHAREYMTHVRILVALVLVVALVGTPRAGHA